MKLSIIIPVYNIEAHLGNCLDSVFRQKTEDFEVVCVNDGSTDASQAIIDQYASTHANLRCIRQPNRGLSAARNSGICQAHGDYLFFLDGDDTLFDDTSLNSILQLAILKKADVCVFNAMVNGERPYLANFPAIPDDNSSGGGGYNYFIP